jgi:RHS repeat-associated protein
LGLTENLTYVGDVLHRLDTSTVGGIAVSYDYDALGNITNKTDLGSGAWTYDPVKKHQLLSAAGGTVVHTYDANGNVLTRNGQAITWTSYNYPSRINKSGTEYDEFFYGPNRERWKQVYTNGSAIETTLSLGKFLEKVVAGGGTDWRHYLSAGGQTVAVYSRQSSGSNTVRYVLGDHQGSIAALASSAGALIVNESFTPFGQRRSGTTWQLPIAGADQTTLDGISRRGYTEHTHLGGAPLIHMNGRVQDPLTGWFVSADPYVTAPGSTQGWNRYSYVMNSPLRFTDPSGFDPQDVLDEITVSGRRVRDCSGAALNVLCNNVNIGEEFLNWVRNIGYAAQPNVGSGGSGNDGTEAEQPQSTESPCDHLTGSLGYGGDFVGGAILMGRVGVDVTVAISSNGAVSVNITFRSALYVGVGGGLAMTRGPTAGVATAHPRAGPGSESSAMVLLGAGGVRGGTIDINSTGGPMSVSGSVSLHKRDGFGAIAFAGRGETSTVTKQIPLLSGKQGSCNAGN